MKRLEILFVNNGMVNFKNDFRYLVTQRENINDVLVAFQTLEFDVVAFLKEDQESKTVAMINKLIEIQGRNTKVVFIDGNVKVEDAFVDLYRQQERNNTFDISINDDIFTTSTSCSI